MGEMIEFAANGGSLQGYLAKPEGGGNGQGVVVVQEWWGLVPHIKDIADRFAAAGYVALAPDLYRGETTTNPDEAGRKMMALNIDQAATDLRGAVEAIRAQGGADKVGVVGFCLGGQLALYTATVSPRVAACVDFYGVHPNVKPDFSKLDCPVLGLFGKNDDFVSPEAAKGLVEAIESAGKSIEHHSYDAGHAFFNDTRPEAYHEAAAKDAWQRTLDFFGQHLAA
ncbi:MAG: dienelactone hydrolase family protein [Deltaproteobacteria bacterium]|jgi:carboxymethylenebutenolidase|nr:dienelactone hydrolase family protein [Deltaproteobacteria bacterium]